MGAIVLLDEVAGRSGLPLPLIYDLRVASIRYLRLAKRILGANQWEKIVNRKIALVFVLMLVSAITLSYLASEFTVLPFDLKSYHELQEEANPLFYVLMHGVSYIGETSIAMLLIVITVAIFALQRQWLEAIFMLPTTSSVLLTLSLRRSYIERFHFR